MGANVDVSWVDSSAPVESYEEAIKPNTKVIFLILSFLYNMMLFAVVWRAW